MKPERHGLRDAALLDQPRDGRPGRRGPLAGRRTRRRSPSRSATSGSPTRRGPTTPAFFAVRQAHLAAARLTGDLLAAGAGRPWTTPRPELATGFLLDALAPTNFLLTNPAALKRALETGGASLAAGAG
jgi:hypothetical protein